MSRSRIGRARRQLLVAAFALLILPLSTAAEEAESYDHNWPQWRGPHGTGEAPHGDPPTTWSETENVRFKVEVPGRGHASPIVWGDRVYLLSAVAGDPIKPPEPPPEGEEQRRRGIVPEAVQHFVVLAYDRGDGSLVWQRKVRSELPHEGTHRDATWASASPLTDGEHLYAHFGSRGLYCLDLAGNVKWEKDLGDMSTRRGFGEGSSPVVHGDTLVVNWDHEGPSFIVALDKKTGEQRWRVEREGEVTSWSTPVVVEIEGRPQVVVSATERVRGYDLESGKVIWELGGQTVNVVPSPIVKGGVAYAMSGFRGSASRAIRLQGAKGDLEGSPAVLWSYDQDTPYVPSSALHRGALYFLKGNTGIMTVLDATTGEPLSSRMRLPDIDNVYASPVAAAGRVYMVGRGGTVAVVSRGEGGVDVLATNTLDDGFDASPAIAGKELFLRGQKSLYCLAEEPAPKAVAAP